MRESNLKNIVVLKNLPSNFIEEAFVILRSNKAAMKLEKIEKNKKAETCNTSKKNKDYVLKEAEMVISNYISNIEDPNKNKSNKLKANRKYIRLKNYAYISSVIMFIQFIMLIIK